MIILDSMGHLYSDESLKELYDFAVRKLRLNPEWNHYGVLFPHFDLIGKRMKHRAISLGAIPVNARIDMSKHIKDGVSHYSKCKKWTKEMITICKAENIVGAYLCKGIYGQPIKRLNFDIMKKFI